MKLIDKFNCPDSTYFTATDVEPEIHGEELWLTSGQGGRRRSWGAPQVGYTVLIDNCEFTAIHVGFSHKHRGGQFYRYFVKIDGGYERRTWAQLTDDERQIVLDAYEAKAPAWANRPGKLSTERRKPSSTAWKGYKIMRMVDSNNFTSLYNATPWQLGKRNGEAAKDNHGGGFYVHPLADSIKELWDDGRLVNAELVTPGTYALVACECSGNQIQYSSGKIAVTYCKPVEVVETFEVK